MLQARFKSLISAVKYGAFFVCVKPHALKCDRQIKKREPTQAKSSQKNQRRFVRRSEGQALGAPDKNDGRNRKNDEWSCPPSVSLNKSLDEAEEPTIIPLSACADKLISTDEN